MAINRHYGTNMVDAGVSRRPMSLNGTLYNRVGLAVASGTAEAVLLTLAIPKGAINAKGKGLRIRVIYSSLASGTTKVYSLRVGSLTGTVIATVNSAANSVIAQLDAFMFLVDESTGGWEGYSWMRIGSSAISGARVSETTDIRGDWDLVLTATSASSAGDVLLRAVTVELITEGGLTPG